MTTNTVIEFILGFIIAYSIICFCRFVFSYTYQLGMLRGYYLCLRGQGRSHESTLEYIEEKFKSKEETE